MFDPESLFLIYDQEPQVLERDVLRQESVSPHHDVDLAFRHAEEDLLLLLGRTEST